MYDLVHRWNTLSILWGVVWTSSLYIYIYKYIYICKSNGPYPQMVSISVAFQIYKRLDCDKHAWVFLIIVELSYDCRTPYCTAILPYSIKLQFASWVVVMVVVVVVVVVFASWVVVMVVVVVVVVVGGGRGVAVFDKNQGNPELVQSTCRAYHNQQAKTSVRVCKNARVSVTNAISLLTKITNHIYILILYYNTRSRQKFQFDTKSPTGMHKLPPSSSEKHFFQFYSNVLFLRTHIEIKIKLYWYPNNFDIIMKYEM